MKIRHIFIRKKSLKYFVNIIIVQVKCKILILIIIKKKIFFLNIPIEK